MCLRVSVCVCDKGSPALGLIIADSLAAEVRMSRDVSHRDRIELHICTGVCVNYMKHLKFFYQTERFLRNVIKTTLLVSQHPHITILNQLRR